MLNAIKSSVLFPAFGAALAVAGLSGAPQLAEAKNFAVEKVKRQAESEVRGLLDPIVNRYCSDQCKLLSVEPEVEVVVPDEVAPGFDELTATASVDLAPAAVRVKMLMDDMLGPVTRGKFLDLMQQHLDGLPYPVQIETKLAHFPKPASSTRKVTALREKVSREFKDTLNTMLRNFCPDACMLADFDIEVAPVNPEEAQYGASGEYVQDGDTAIRIGKISATILMDNLLSPEERSNIVEMARLKTGRFENVQLNARSMRFPKPGEYAARGINGRAGQGNSRSLASESKSKSDTSANSTLSESNTSNSTSTNSENNMRQERYERIEKIERVEDGSAVQEQLKTMGVYGLVFACAVLSLLIFIVMAAFRPRSSSQPSVSRIIQNLTSDPVSASSPSTYKGAGGSDSMTKDDRQVVVAKRYEIDRLHEELTRIFAEQPKVAKQVFTRLLTEEGVETTAEYIDMFGESVVLDMLRDPSLQRDLSELTEFYAKNTFDLSDDEKIELLRRLHNRTVAAKMVVMGNRSSNLFDFLAEMDGTQILELVRNESMTVKAIVMTQVDPQKQQVMYSHMEEDSRMTLLAELSRIDHLPREYIYNVSTALKRKQTENPRLNTEALPGSDVLVSLLERTGFDVQKSVVSQLEVSNPDNARALKGKLVSIDTLRFLRDGQLLEVVLSLRHDELLQFLKGAPEHLRKTIFDKAPDDLVVELEEELTNVQTMGREGYLVVERKIMNRIKRMAAEGLINLVETNDRMFSGGPGHGGIVAAAPGEVTQIHSVAS